MRLKFFRRVIAPIAVVSIALTGCSSGSEVNIAGGSKNPDESVAKGPVSTADSDFAGFTDLTVEADFTPVEAGSNLLAPGVDLQVTQIATLSEVSAAVYEDVTGGAPEADDPEDLAEDEVVESVRAADGYQFYVAKFSSSDPQWKFTENLPRTTGTLRVNGSEVEQVLNTDNSTRYQATIIVSLAEGATAKDAVIEIETQEKLQSISLIDGQRVTTDVPQTYESAGLTAQVTSADEIDEGFIGWAKQDDRVNGKVIDAFVTPWLDRSHRGDGWATSGKMYISIEVEWRNVSSTTFDKTSMHLRLANGDIVHPQNDINLGRTLSENAVFLVPTDATEFTAVIEPKVVVGAGASAPVHEWDPLEANIVLSATAE